MSSLGGGRLKSIGEKQDLSQDGWNKGLAASPTVWLNV